MIGARYLSREETAPEVTRHEAAGVTGVPQTHHRRYTRLSCRPIHLGAVAQNPPASPAASSFITTIVHVCACIKRITDLTRMLQRSTAAPPVPPPAPAPAGRALPPLRCRRPHCRCCHLRWALPAQRQAFQWRCACTGHTRGEATGLAQSHTLLLLYYTRMYHWCCGGCLCMRCRCRSSHKRHACSGKPAGSERTCGPPQRAAPPGGRTAGPG